MFKIKAFSLILCAAIFGEAYNPIIINKGHSINLYESLAYQHITKYELIYGAGIEHGNRTYQYGIHFDNLAFADTSPVLQIMNYAEDYALTTGYWGLNIQVGYHYDFKALKYSDWYAEFKAMVSLTAQIKGFKKEYDLIAGYPIGDTFMVRNISEISVQMGKGEQKFGGPIVGCLYFGVGKQVHCGIIKDINLGFTYSHILKYPSSASNQIITNYGMTTVVSHFYNGGKKIEGKPNSVDSYTPKESSFGISLSVGFGLPG